MSSSHWAITIAGVNFALWTLLYFWIYYNLLLIYLAWRARRERPGPTHAGAPDEWPRVTIQLPLYNEAEVCETLIDSVAAIDYPQDRLYIQVLDDSTDETAALIAARVQELRDEGLRIEHLQRDGREGYKAGALAHGLEHSDDELVLILDADFVPRPDLLRQLVPYFEDPDVGMVQGRWGHVDEPSGALERTARFWIDRHFAIEQFARSRWGHFFHFNGTGGIWRRAAIDDAGGWSADTLAEDLDLSLRAWQRGWRFVYAHDVVVPALLPPNVRALKIQQGRWAKGAFQVARKHLPSIWGSRGIRTRDRGLISLHLTGYSFPVILLLISLLAGPAAWARLQLDGLIPLLFIDLPAITFVGGMLIQAIVAAWRRGKIAGWTEVEASSIGLGLAPLVARSGLDGLRRLGGAFRRTPKRSGESGWRLDGGAALELVLSVVCGAGALMAAFYGGWSVLPLPLLACLGLAVFGWGSVRGSPRRRTL